MIQGLMVVYVAINVASFLFAMWRWYFHGEEPNQLLERVFTKGGHMPEPSPEMQLVLSERAKLRSPEAYGRAFGYFFASVWFFSFVAFIIRMIFG